MNVLTKTLIVAICGLAITACGEFKGALKVDSPLTMTVEGGSSHGLGAFGDDFDATKNVTLQPSSYDANIIIASRNRIQFSVKKGYTTYRGEINTKNVDIPNSGEEFMIPASQTGQPFGLKGNINEQVSETSPTKTTETCSKEVSRMVCSRGRNHDHNNRRGHNGNGHGSEKKCEMKYKTIYGDKKVEYYYRTTDTYLALNLLSANGNKTQASYSGAKSDQDKIYTYQGPCRFNSYHDHW